MGLDREFIRDKTGPKRTTSKGIKQDSRIQSGVRKPKKFKLEESKLEVSTIGSRNKSHVSKPRTHQIVEDIR